MHSITVGTDFSGIGAPEPATIFVVIGENEVPEISQAEANYIYAIENPK